MLRILLHDVPEGELHILRREHAASMELDSLAQLETVRLPSGSTFQDWASWGMSPPVTGSTPIRYSYIGRIWKLGGEL